jgi:uncharacterized Zn finger protein
MAISESDIPEWLGDTDAARGERYQRQGRVSHLRRTDDGLRAHCQGSQPDPYTVRVTLADEFAQADGDDAAEHLLLSVKRDSDHHHEHRTREKPLDFYSARDRYDDALDIALDLFDNRPRCDHLQQVEHLAREVGRWKNLETELLNELCDTRPDQLIWYYLEDDDPDAAVAIWESTDLGTHFDRAKFADAVADTHPNIAIDLFDSAAERLIANRGRDNYRAACQHIARLRDLYRATDREADWHHHRDRLLDDHSNLPAFKDEMQKAGLTDG